MMVYKSFYLKYLKRMMLLVLIHPPSSLGFIVLGFLTHLSLFNGVF